MASTVVASLLTRWALIKQSCEDFDISELDFRRLKEKWFLEAFQLLQNAPKEDHCWCNHREVMYPLLEPFSWYFEEPNPQSALHTLWRRLCSELSACTKCVKIHHEAKEEYKKEYDEVHVEPLLAVLQVLDEERVELQLKTLLNLIKEDKFDSMKHTAEVATVTFEVLMFPSLLEDAEVSELFGPFLQYVDDICDLVLEKGSQYPGVYSLLVHADQKVRRVAFKLVQSLEMIKDCQEMEAIAPLLEKVMHCLEFEEFDLRTSGAGFVGQIKLTIGEKGITQSSHLGTLRPRVRYKRDALWLGLPNILERMLPVALEEGIVERYSVFVSIVLNHVSEARTEFYHALKCLELLLSNLGYRFWLRTTFSAGVVRNTLVSQCFHSDKQRMHASIFELFPPFLLSLETLQDEYERQRRRLLYFLLQQVPASKNFNLTMRWKARQVSFKIICTGYCMEPPLPPWECAHVWGPPLVETLKDPNMYGTFRSTAFDLIQIILAADTSALAAFSLKPEGSEHPWGHLVETGNHENGPELRVATEASRDQEYWRILKRVSYTMSEGHEKWSCVPLLWSEVLGGVLAYPTSFYKSVLWAYGRIAIVDLPGNMKVADVHPKVLIWETPKGYDDQSDSVSCANVVPVQWHCLQLTCAFKRYADGFRGCLNTVLPHLTLEPWFAEPLLLLLMSSDLTWKDVAQVVLIQSGASSSLESGLKLLCNSDVYVSAVCDAVRHASQMLLNWPLENCERALSQLFFLGLKFLNLNQGAPETVVSESSSALLRLRESMSMILWPLVGKTIMESKQLIGGNHELMLTRLLQLLPSVCKHMPISFQKALFGIHNPKKNGINWFHDLLALGSLASKAVLRWWQTAACDIVANLVQSGCLSAALKDIISDLLKPGCPLEEDQQRRLQFLLESASASPSYTRGADSWTAQDKPTKFARSGRHSPYSTAEFIDLDSDDEDVQERHHQSRLIEEKHLKRLDLDLTDLEGLNHVTSALSDVTVKDHKKLVREGDQVDKAEEVKEWEEMEEMEEADDPADSVPLASLFLKPQPSPPSRIVHPQRRKPGEFKLSTLDKYVHKTPKPPIGRPVQKKRPVLPSLRVAPSVSKSQVNSVNSKQPATSKQPISTGKQPIVAETALKNKPQGNPNRDTVLKPTGQAARTSAVLRELVMDDDDDLVKALNAVRKLPSREKRQVMTLQMPGEQIRPAMIVSRPVLERAPPPKLDMWFRQILSLDYFSTVGLECLWVEDRLEPAPLTKVPLTFSSVEKYKEIFQPLVLEEFKAQLGNSFKELSVSDGKTCAVLRLMSLERVDDFQIGRFLTDGHEDAARSWLENDLLLLTRHRLEPNEPQSCHILAKVDRKEREFRGSATTILLKLCMPQGNSRLQSARKYLVSRSKWHMTRVMSLSSQIREFQALSAVGNFPLLQTILCSSKHSLGKNNVKVDELKGLTSDLCDRFRVDYNESQVSAIAASVGQQDLAAADHQLALVQGPPGTGKTRTIVGIVSALLAWEPQTSKVSEMRASTNGRGGVPFRTSASSSVSLARAWQDAALAVEMSGGKENFPGLGKAKETMIRGGSRKRRILVCAQSNAAVDELVARLCKDGLYGKHGEFFRPFLVRVGNVKVVHPASMDIFIDTLVEKRLVAERNAHANVEDNRQQKIQSLRRKLEEVIESIQVLEASHAKRSGADTVSGQPADQSVQDSAEASIASPAEKDGLNAEAPKWVDRVVQEGDSAVQGKLNALYSQRRQVSAELAHAEKEEKKIRGEEWAKRQEIRRAVIREADVVLATLNTCGADVYSACMENFVPAKKYQPRKDAEDDFFNAVVIDEAGQALEPATLIPLQLLKQTQARCVLVGDPKQLPATLISQSASKMGFELSMFERLQRAGYPVTVLNTQYRMHPEIRRFPSAHFYDGQLTDGEGLAEGSRQAPFHNEWCFAPYVFFDVVDGYQSAPSKSLCNDAEADAALNIYRAFQQRYPEEANSRSISVITPYKEQRRVLEQRFNRSIGSAEAFNIDFNTVDGYQGREVDILIFSTVRASSEDNKAVGRGNNIGFVADVRRMNVALTRARFSLWIVGNASALKQNSDWAALLIDAQTRNVYFRVKSPYVFGDDATSRIRKITGLPAGSGVSAAMNEAHIALPRSSENVNSTERVGHEHASSKRREGPGFMKSRAVEDPLQENERSFGAHSVERDPSSKVQQASERRIETAVDESQMQRKNSMLRIETSVDEPRMQRKNSMSRGERNASSATRNRDDKDWIRRSHPDGSSSALKRINEHSLPAQERPKMEDAANSDLLSSRRLTDVDPRKSSSNTKSRGSHIMPEETRTELRMARARDAPLTRARPKVSNEQSEKSSSMKATQNYSAVEGVGCDRSNEDTIERIRPSIQDQNDRSSPAASMLNSRPHTGSRSNSHGSAPASRNQSSRGIAPTSRNEGSRGSAPASRNEGSRGSAPASRNEGVNAHGSAPASRNEGTNSHGSAPASRNDGANSHGGAPASRNESVRSVRPSVNVSEPMRTHNEERHTGSSRVRDRDSSDPVQNSHSERRTKQTGRSHLEVGRSDSDLGRTRQAGHPPPRSGHLPPTKKQKIAGGASVAQNVAPASTVDDILSGLGNLSRSQVIGSRAIDEPLTKQNTTRRL